MKFIEALTEANEARWNDAKDGERTYARAETVCAALGELVGSEYLSHVAQRHLRQVANDLLKTRSPSTVNRYMAAFMGMVDACKETGKLGISEIARLTWKPLREPNGRDYCPSRDAVERFAYGGYGVSMCAHVLATTGLRLGELMSLTSDDLQIHNGRAYICVVESKSGHSRLVPVTERVVELFHTIVHYCSTNSRSVFYRDWHKLRQELNLPPEFTPHCLRHYRASTLASSGASVQVVAAILGHRDWRTTQRYTHIDGEAMHEALANADN